MLIELPVLIPIGAEPVARIVVPLVGEADCDAVAVECPEFLDQAILKFLDPFTREDATMSPL